MKQPVAPAPVPAPAWHRWVPLALGLAALALYLVSLHRDLAGGDSGELCAVACSGGVAHPPGYPLHTLLSRLFLLLPFGVPAARMNALSAVAEAVAVWGIAVVMLRLTRRPSAAVISAGLFAVAPGIWEYARVSEVFALNNALIAVALVCAYVDFEQRSKRSAALFGLFSGLALSNHQTSLFFLVPLGLWRLWQHPHAKVLVGFGLLGLGSYLILMFTGRTNTNVTWGDTTTLKGLWHHITRADYGTTQLANGGLANQANVFTFLGGYFKSEFHQTWGIGLVLMVAGLVWGWKRTFFKPVALVAGSWAAYLLVFGSLSNLPLDVPLTLGVVGRFWQMPHLYLCLLAGLSVLWVPTEKITAGVAVIAVLVLGVINSREIDFGGNSVLRDYGMKALDRRPNALLMIQGDVLGNPVRYLQACENVRPDVQVIDQAQLTFEWHVRRLKSVFPRVKFAGTRWHPRDPGTFTLKQFLTDNLPYAPIDTCGRFKAGDDSAKNLITLWPDTACDWVVPNGANFDVENWLAVVSKPVDPQLGDHPWPPGSWELEAATGYWQQRSVTALKLLNVGIERGQDPRFFKRSVEIYKEIDDHLKEKSAGLYKNYGIAAGRLALTDPSYETLTYDLLEKFVALAPKNDPDYEKLKAAVDQWKSNKKPKLVP